MIVAGFGFRGTASTDSLRAALEATGQAPRVQALATLADKVPGLAPLAADLDLPLVSIPEDQLSDIDTPTVSLASEAARGLGSVSEAVALGAAGPNAKLLVPRQISPDGQATCAIADGQPT